MTCFVVLITCVLVKPQNFIQQETSFQIIFSLDFLQQDLLYASISTEQTKRFALGIQSLGRVCYLSQRRRNREPRKDSHRETLIKQKPRKERRHKYVFTGLDPQTINIVIQFYYKVSNNFSFAFKVNTTLYLYFVKASTTTCVAIHM